MFRLDHPPSDNLLGTTSVGAAGKDKAPTTYSGPHPPTFRAEVGLHPLGNQCHFGRVAANRFTREMRLPGGAAAGDPQTKVSGRMLVASRRDFGPPRELGTYFLSSPVCMDALGETWAGYAMDGVDRGRMVLVTVVAAERRSRALDELLGAAKLASSIRHAEVLALLDVHQTDEELALVSEYLDGEPLSTLLSSSAQKETPFQEGVALRIASDAANALSRLREARKDVGFGGISPEVLYLPTYGELLLRHPRLSEVAMQQLYLRRKPSTLPYRAPEQLRNPRSIDETADVFSLGVLLWEMLAMRPLFGEESHTSFAQTREFAFQTPQDVERKIRSLPIPDLMKVQRPGAALSPEVVGIVSRCLKRDPRKRYPSLKELCQAFDALPRGLVADIRAVASTVDRLGGELIRRREEHMSEIAPMPLRSSAPPSGRASHFPDESAQVTIALPQRIDESRLKDLLSQADLRGELPPSTENPWQLSEEVAELPPRPLPPFPALGPQDTKAPAAAVNAGAQRQGERIDPAKDVTKGPVNAGPATAGGAGGDLAWRGPAEDDTTEDDAAEDIAAHYGTADDATELLADEDVADEDVANEDVADEPPISTERSSAENAGSSPSAAALPAVALPSHRRHGGSWRAAVAASLLLCGGAWGAWTTLGPESGESPPPAPESAEDAATPEPSAGEPSDVGASELKEEPPAQKAPHPEGHDPEEKSADLDQEGEQPRPEPAPSVNRPTVRPKSSGTPRSPKPKKVAPSGSAPARKADGAFRPTGI